MESRKTVRIEYCAPPDVVLEHFAHRVCWEMGCSERRVEDGLAGFMKVIARATAKELTRKANGEFDL